MMTLSKPLLEINHLFTSFRIKDTYYDAIHDVNLTLNENLVSGTYKFIFKLYDGENYIGEVEKIVIIK